MKVPRYYQCSDLAEVVNSAKRTQNCPRLLPLSIHQSSPTDRAEANATVD